MPKDYYKPVYLPQYLYEDMEMIAELERKNIRQTVIGFLNLDVKYYMERHMDQEAETRRLMQAKLIPYKPPGPWLQMMRKYLERHGIENPRTDKGYKVV